jgi:hypothetical protein
MIRGKRMLPGTVEGMNHVCYFRHALALDERRVKFLPEYAYGGTTLPPPSVLTEKGTNTSLANHEPNRKNNPPNGDGNSTTAKNELSEDILPTDNEAKDDQARMKSTPHTMEVWFAGTHSDM